ELELTFVRSSGPGGENVNRVNSKAVLRWNVEKTTGLPEDVRNRFIKRFANRISQSGDVVLTSDKYREQPRNAAECIDRLRQLVQAVRLAPPKRTRTRPTRGSVERRLQEKRSRSQRKQQRRFRPDSDG